MNEPLLSIPDPEDSSKDGDRSADLGVVGTAMVGVANCVWAVVGLFFWVPLLVRAVLLSAVRIVHSAVTRQPPTYLRAFIASETRFYLAGFWTRKRLKQVGSQRKYHLKLRRLVGEVLWAGAFYLGLLRLVDRGACESRQPAPLVEQQHLDTVHAGGLQGRSGHLQEAVPTERTHQPRTPT